MTRQEVSNKTVKERIGGNKDHGWNADDSLAVIIALCEDEMGERPDDGFAAAIKAMINPSQVRQAFEKIGLLNPTDSAKTKSALKALAESLKS